MAQTETEWGVEYPNGKVVQCASRAHAREEAADLRSIGIKARIVRCDVTRTPWRGL